MAYNSGIHNRQLKEQICEIGRRLYMKNMVSANDGNISIRVGENEVLCTPTMICKGFMTPEDLCAVDLNGNQIAGKRKKTSEILLHLEIMKHRPDAIAVVHCHAPHATAFALAGEPIPQCVLPEVEVLLGETPIAPYDTPGSTDFAKTVVPFLKNGTNTILLKNHGTVSFGATVEEAFWKTEIIDSYCRILLLARQLGPIDYLNEGKLHELLDLKKRMGIDDPRFHENCDLCSNDAYRAGYKENKLQPKVFADIPKYGSYLKKSEAPTATAASSSSVDIDQLVQQITNQVMAAMGG
jgi:L-fuculose-phosphate aldolase